MTVSGNGRIAVLQVQPTYLGDDGMTKVQKIDAKRMKSTMEILAKASGMRLHITKLNGNKASKLKISKWIEAQKKNPPTVAVLDCNGHGLRDSTSRWPIFGLSEDKLVQLSTVMKRFEQIPSTLTVAHIDACNSTDSLNETHSLKRAQGRALGLQYVVHKESKKIKKKAQTKKTAKVGSKALLNGFKGHVRVAAASPGEYAIGDPHKLGGVSTVLMQGALLGQCMRGKKASWKHIEKDFKEVKKLKASQTPLVSVQVKKVSQHTHEHKHSHSHKHK